MVPKFNFVSTIICNIIAVEVVTWSIKIGIDSKISWRFVWKKKKIGKKITVFPI